MSNTDTTTTIRLMWNTSAFVDTSLPSNVTTIAHLREHLGNVPTTATMNYNGVEWLDESKVLEDGATLAIVARNKTGG